MIDNIKFELPANIPQHLLFGDKPFTHYEMQFIPSYGEHGDIYGFWAKIRNLRVTVYRSTGNYRVENSIHKFAMGNNYSDFTRSKLLLSLQELSFILQENIHEAVIKHIEIGCNIIVPDANGAWKKLGSYKGKNYQPQYYKGEGYGASCILHNYVIKGYNKTTQVKAVDKKTIQENTFRAEVNYKRMAALHERKNEIRLYKVKDLLNPEIMQQLGDDVVNKYRESLKNETAVNPVTLREATAYSRMSQPEVKELLRLNHKDTYTQDRAIYRQLMKAADNDDYLETMLTEKFRQLLNT